MNPALGASGAGPSQSPQADSRGTVRVLKSPQTRAGTRARARLERDLGGVPLAPRPRPRAGAQPQARTRETRSPAPGVGPSGRAPGPRPCALQAGSPCGSPLPWGHNLGGWGRSVLRPVSQPSPHSQLLRKNAVPRPPARSRPPHGPHLQPEALPRRPARAAWPGRHRQRRSHLLWLRSCPARNAPGTAVPLPL